MRSASHIRFITIAIIICKMLLMFAVIYANVFPRKSNFICNNIRFVFQQSWGFFTAKTENYIDLYRIENGELNKLNLKRSEDYSFFGMSKKSKNVQILLKRYKKSYPFAEVNSKNDLAIFLDTATLHHFYPLNCFLPSGRYAVISEPFRKNNSRLQHYPILISLLNAED